MEGQVRGASLGGRRKELGPPFIPGFPMSGLGPQTNVCSKNTCFILLFVLGKTPHDQTPHWGDPERVATGAQLQSDASSNPRNRDDMISDLDLI